MDKKTDFLSERITEMNLAPASWVHEILGAPSEWPRELKTLMLTMLASPVPSYICWGPQRIFLFNRAYQPLLAARAEIAFGRDFKDIWPEVWPELSPLFDAVARGETFAFRDHPLNLRRKGFDEACYFDFSFGPIYDSQSQVCGLQCLCAETTGKMAARKIVETERVRFRNLMNDAPFAVAMLEGPEHVFSYVNDPYRTLVGHRKLEGLSVRQAFPELAGQGFYELLDKVVQSGKTFTTKEIDVVLKDLEGRPYALVIELIYAARRNQEGVVEGVGVFAIDVSDKVKERKNAEHNAHFLRLVTDSIPANIAYIDKDFRLRFVNQGLKKNFGVSEEKILGQQVQELLSPEQFQEREAAYRKALEGEAQFLKASYTNVDGSRRITYNSLMPDIDADGEVKGFVGIGHEVTEQERLREALEQAKTEAEAANSAKSAFLANMSHEIRSPLGAMMGFISILREGHLSNEDTQRYLDIITRNSQQVIRIIDDILDLSKVEANKMTIENIDFRLPDVLADFGSIMGFKAKENGIDFIVHAENELPSRVCSDPTRLRQILTNVVGNAIKFTSSGSVSLFIGCEKNILRFKVVDTGIGIEAKEAERLFQAFHQADISTTRKFGGTGLGLILTRKLCEAMGGSFWLEESTPEKGSTFVATIAVTIPTDTNASSFKDLRFLSSKSVKAPDKPFLGKKILVVDDSPDNQLLVGVMLKRAGASVDTANDGQEGLESALEGDFDLVVMDVQMPRMGGYEAVKALRDHGYTAPVVALTAHAMIDERKRCLDAGYSDFLTKPIDREDLIQVLKDRLDL